MQQLPEGFVIDEAPEQNSGPIYGPAPAADPYAVPEEQRAQGRYNQESTSAALTNELARIKIDKEQKKTADEAEADAARQSAEGLAVQKLAQLIRKMNQVAIDADDNQGWLETGTSGRIARAILPEGQAGNDLQANISTIQANFAFDALQAMREASKTGGALGSVSEGEMNLLKASVANIDPNQSHQQFLQNLTAARDAYLAKLELIDPELAQELGHEAGPYTYDGSNGEVRIFQKRERNAESSPTGAPPPDAASNDDGVWFKGVPGLEGDYSPTSLAKGFGQGLGDMVEGVGDMLGVIGNPANATVNAATGAKLSTDIGTTLRQNVGLPDNPNKLTSAINKGGIGALSGAGTANALARIANPGTIQAVLGTLARTPVRDTVAGAGAGAGMVAGDEVGGPVGGLVGALAGGVTGYAGANAFMRAATPKVPNALALASERQGVDMLPADAGGPVTKALTTGAKASPLSVGPIVNQAKANQDQFVRAVNRVARNEGDIDATSDSVGESIRTAANNYGKKSGQTGSKLYDRAAGMARGVKSIRPTNTIKAIDEELARLRENPAAPESTISELSRLRSKVEGGVSIQGLRDARTRLSDSVYDGNLRGSTDQRMWKEILNNVADDIDVGLRSVGKERAANAFRTADRFWSERVQHIDEVLQPIIGRDGTKSGEDIVTAIESMARGKSGGNARLSRLLGQMESQEAGNVRAALVTRMGKANPGAQTAEGDAFSASTFLTNWNRMTPQAKASIFSDGQMRRDLDDLAKLAEGSKQTQQISNHSNTGVAITANAGLMGASAFAHPAFSLGIAGLQNVTGRLLASPKFAQVLARTAKMPPERAARSVSEQLGVLATREPLIAGEARVLQQQLQESLGQSPTTQLAAEEKNQNVRREPIN